MNTFMMIILLLILLFCMQTSAVRKLTIPSRNTHPACKRNDILHSDVVEDRSLKKGISPQNYTLLGLVPSMADCMALCCSAKYCNIAYMKNDTCYAVSCRDSDNCEVENGTAVEDEGTKLALIIRNEMNRRVYVTAYLIVVVCAFGAAMSGTVWAVFIFYKRYSIVSGEKRTPDSAKSETPVDGDKPLAKRMHY